MDQGEYAIAWRHDMPNLTRLKRPWSALIVYEPDIRGNILLYERVLMGSGIVTGRLQPGNRSRAESD